MGNDNAIDPIKTATEFTYFTGRSLFITGKAGTGKTTFLKSVRENCSKKLIILAPTGIAAVNANALTIHSFFQFPFDILDEDFFKTSFPRYNEAKKEVIEQLELLIIDEVSMVRADIMDAIDKILRFYRRKETIPFGGVQLVLIGDLFQLSPVLNDQDRLRMKKIYSSPFFFDADSMKSLDFVKIEFTSIFRQVDERFISLLNNVRNNACSDEDLKFLNVRCINDVVDENEYIFLTTHKYKAEEINRKAVDKLKAPLVSINAIIQGEFPESFDPAPRILEIKLGAQVIFTKNDSSEKKEFYNGKKGMVAYIGEERLRIRVSESEVIELDRSTWSNRGAKYDALSGKIETIELGSFRQFPIKLAWAITIHKSQGMTFEKAIIDAQNSFAPGQVYVALSRLKTLAGLVLQSPITKGAIQTDPRIVSFHNGATPSGDLAKMVLTDKVTYRHQLLVKLLSLEKFNRTNQVFCNKYNDIVFGSTCKVTLDELMNVFAKFEIQLADLLSIASHDQYQAVQIRVRQASDYFTRMIDELFIQPLQEYASTIKEIKKNEPLIEELNLLLRLYTTKKREFSTAVKVVQGLTDGTETVDLVETITKQHEGAEELKLDTKKKEQNNKKSTTQSATLSLFQKGLTINEIAQKRELNRGIIEDHLNSFIKSGEITVHQLVTQEKADMIAGLHQQNPEWSVHEMRLALGSGFSFGEIRAVLETL